jgi:hypothetical protein
MSACNLADLAEVCKYLVCVLLEVLEILEKFVEKGKMSVLGMGKPVFVLFERNALIFQACCESAAEQYRFMMPMKFDGSSGIVKKGFSGRE